MFDISLNKIKETIENYFPKFFIKFLIKVWRNFFIPILNFKINYKLKKFKKPLYKEIKFRDKKFKILIDPKNGSIDKQLYLNSIYEPEIMNIFYNNLNRGDIFLDIGTNIGYHSLFASTIVCNEGKVISFEPIKRIYSQFKKSIQKNGFNNIETNNLACGFKESKETIYIDSANVGNSMIFERDLFDSKEEITIINYDKKYLKQKIHFVKIDTEGFEYEVLKGMKKSLEKYGPKIILEFTPYLYKKIYGKKHFEISKGIIDLLVELNYDIYNIFENNLIKVNDIKKFLNKTKYQTNIFCVKK